VHLQTTPNVAICTRVSTHEQAESGYGLDDQMNQCRRLVCETGATIVAEYEDRESGTRMDLPGLTALLDDAERRRFEIVYCYDPDRLSRKLATYVILEAELDRLDVALRFVTIRGGDTPEDRAMLHMKAVFAEYDHGRIITSLTNGKRTKAEKGMYVGTGVPPYGYRYLLNEKGRAYALEEDPVTGAIVRRIFRDVQTTSVHAHSRQLTSEGVRTYFAHRLRMSSSAWPRSGRRWRLSRRPVCQTMTRRTLRRLPPRSVAAPSRQRRRNAG
jgi:site-specific DNA recombinase